jgi:glycosyltransferase involved in cell wall biosynthesis
MVGPDPYSKGGIATLERNILENANHDFYRYSMHIARPEGSFFLKFALVPIYTVFFMLKVLTFKYSIVHIHISENWGFYRYVPFILFSWLIKLKIVIHPNACEFDQFYARQNTFLRWIIRFHLNRADQILTVSTEWAEVFRYITKAEVSVVYNFVDVPPKNMYNPKSITITSAGQLGRRKGYYDMLTVVPQILKKNSEIRFKFCGNGEINEIKSELERNQIEKYVYVMGWLDNNDLKEILKDTVLFVLPTYHEGMPLAILEAMSFGIPIISTTVGGIPSLVENGVNGILVEPGQSEALFLAIDKLLNYEELRILISHNNYRKISNDFTAESNMRKIYNVYERIVTKK